MLHLHGFQDQHHVTGTHVRAGRRQPLNNLGLQGGTNLVHGPIVRHLKGAFNLLHNAGMQLEPLIQLTRGGLTENLHLGAVAVVNTQGAITAQAGDPQWLTFTRSCLKALQALPFVESGGPAQFGFSAQLVALMCASHNGEQKHVDAAQDMLDKAGVSYKTLKCGCHVPLQFSFFDKAPPADFVADERHNNCSGKHSGFLAYCVQHGHALQDYLEPEHPLQQAIRRDVARAVGMDANDMPMGIDGCSAPNYAMPLWRLAYGYARLASGAQDAEFGASFATLSNAMTSHPDMVSGTGRNDLAFMQVGRGDWVSKVGADAVQVVGSKERGEAFAIKIIDGNKPALYAASVEVMDQLGWLDAGQRSALQPWRAQPIVNARGILVGERIPTFKLQKP